ncbi:MAG: hypothetical protein GC145_09710 [Caulobacter sp.]|nr:hypothetical protein [Caulobacter sp.]
MFRAALIALALLLPSAALAQTVAPRAVVDHAAKAIEDLYFDAAKGKAIAADLRQEAAAGQYDALTDPRDLATALSSRLRPLDAHFNVSWRPPAPAGGPAQGPGPGPGPRGDRAAVERRGNYGFRTVEMLPGGIGYIRMQFFADFQGEGDPAKAAADAALAMVSNADALIIDLRDNGGGSPAMVGYLVSAFTPKDAKIYNVFHSREGTEDESPPVWFAKPRLDVPVYILVSARTGSAAEAFPYTMQAAMRATIVGEATGGAANPGGPAFIGDGFAIFISRGSPVNPLTGGNWEGEGVKPDVGAPAAQALEVAEARALQDIFAADPDSPLIQDTRWAMEAIGVRLAPHPPVKVSDYVGAYGDIAIVADGEKLLLKRGRRPAWTLVSLGGDQFFDDSDPARRVAFERNGAGKVIAFEIAISTGGGARYRRD